MSDSVQEPDIPRLPSLDELRVFARELVVQRGSKRRAAELVGMDPSRFNSFLEGGRLHEGNEKKLRRVFHAEHFRHEGAMAASHGSAGDSVAERAAYARAKLEAALVLLDALPRVREFVSEALGALAPVRAPLAGDVVDDAERALRARPSADAPAAQ